MKFFRGNYYLQKLRAFTVIEILVVIAIIALMSSLLVIGTMSYRDKAMDSRIIDEMHQFRASAAIVNETNGNYDNVCCGAAPCDANINSLCIDIGNQGGTKPSDDSSGIDIIKPASPANAFCAEVKLNTDKYYCVDSSLTSKQYSSNPACATDHYSCD